MGKNMAAVKLYVTLCLLVLCTCRPTENELPHSRDFYAGYIKALNDNFDILFKPERQTRSISPSEEKGNDAAEEKRAEVLEELIDKNPQKRDDTEGMDIHKRDLLYDDIMNTNTLNGDSSKRDKQSHIRIKNEYIQEKPSAIESNRNVANRSVRSKILENKKDEIEDVTSGEKKTIDEKNSDGDSDDITSGDKRTVEVNSEESESGVTVTNSDDSASGDTEASASISDDFASG